MCSTTTIITEISLESTCFILFIKSELLHADDMMRDPYALEILLAFCHPSHIRYINSQTITSAYNTCLRHLCLWILIIQRLPCFCMPCPGIINMYPFNSSIAFTKLIIRSLLFIAHLQNGCLCFHKKASCSPGRQDSKINIIIMIPKDNLLLQ